MSDQLHYLSISELSKLIETKVISPVEVTKLLLDRIDAIDPELKSYATVMADEALLIGTIEHSWNRTNIDGRISHNDQCVK